MTIELTQNSISHRFSAEKNSLGFSFKQLRKFTWQHCLWESNDFFDKSVSPLRVRRHVSGITAVTIKNERVWNAEFISC